MFKRIVSLAPSISETICALGESNNLVGVTDFCSYPDYCKTRPKIGGFANPKIDAILNLKPDLILATTLHQVEKLKVFKDNGIIVIQIDAKTLFDAPKSIIQIGKALGIEHKANKLAFELKTEINNILEQAKHIQKTKRVCYLCTSTKFCNYKSKCQTNKLVTILGGKLCMYKKVSIVEDILKADPEVIIIPYLEGSPDWLTQQKFIKNNPILKQTTALKNNKLYHINGELLSRPATRAAKGLNQLFQLIHK